MLLLLRTFFDIIALRKGPDSVPASWLVFALSLVCMAISSYAAVALIDVPEGGSDWMTFFAYGLGLFFYASVIYLSGYSARLLQAITTIIACGSLITVFVVAEYVMLKPLLGQELAAIVGTLLVFWSVPVEGHIIARTIEQHWFIGIGIALAAFALQLGL